MEKDINMIIKNVVNMMQEELTEEQMHKLENVLYISFHGVKLQEECTSLVTSQSHWDKILKLFIASKRLENCSQGTIDRYVDCVTKLVNYLNKRFEDITTNDIRYYLAMYQETRKVSISYMDTLRRYFSSFFGWLSDEGFISKNPMRRIKHMRKCHSASKSRLHPQRGSIYVAMLRVREMWQLWSSCTPQQHVSVR